ncbi:MAG TPA: NAD-dependent epimerase/dehydratase family protein [Gemmatimonadales bacterium]|nr:NAD-dependent epimerase/dehydratase family protein [Gemmatimonadales bacterium]
MSREAALEELLSRPTSAVVTAMAALPGDLMLLGAGGKMGPSLARLTRRASDQAGTSRRVIAVARFSEAGLREALEADGVETVACDLFDRSRLAALPDAPNLIYMAGQKFGTTGEAARTWAVNAALPGIVADRFPEARMVAFSTGNVYPLWPADSEGPAETDAVGPVGEYAQSALARERILEFYSRRNATRMALLRLNYAVEPRYGVLRDIAERVWAGLPVSLAMSRVNLIWQRDANAIALRALEHCESPPLVLNLTGPSHRVHALATEFGRRWNKAPIFEGQESESALLSNAARCGTLFGPPETGIGEMIDRVAEWVEVGGRSLGKPTHFETRDGKF